MGVFSFFKNKEPVASPVAVAGAEGERLVMYITPIGWQAAMQQVDGSLTDLRSGDGVLVEGEGWQRTEEIFKQAVVANALSIKRAKTISLLLDDASVQLTDNKPAALMAASGATARQFGKQWLNLEDVAYGHADLPSATAGGPEKQHKDGVYAFIDAQRMRNYLALLDKDGIKVAEAIPKEYIMILHAIRSGRPVYGGVQVSGHFSTLVLVNHALGIVQTRKIPVGFLTLVKAVARRQGVSLQNVVQVMANRDLVADVMPMVDGAEMTQSRTPSSQALQEPLTRLLDEIKEFLAFFSFQKVAGVPEQLELFGAIGRVSGLSEWLSQHVGLSMVASNLSMLDLFVQAEHPIACNLLKGAEGNLLTVGRTQFFFTEDRGFISSQDMAERTSHVVRSETQHSSVALSGARKRPERAAKGRSVSRDAKKSASDDGFKGFLSQLGNRTQTGGSARSLEKENNQDQQFVAIFVLFVLGILYWGYSEYRNVAHKYQSYVDVYLGAREGNNTHLKNILEKRERAHQLGADADAVKIFWSEKFLALAKGMTEHIWLTDVYLSTDMKDGKTGGKTKEKIMVIKGYVLPSTDGHVRIIAKYIHTLLDDKEQFMSDFRDVVFRGAELRGDVANQSGDPKVSFVLHALHDENKRKSNKVDSPVAELSPAQKEKQDKMEEELHKLLAEKTEKGGL